MRPGVSRLDDGEDMKLAVGDNVVKRCVDRMVRRQCQVMSGRLWSGMCG